MKTYGEIYEDVLDKRRKHIKARKKKVFRLTSVCALALAVLIILPTTLMWIASGDNGDSEIPGFEISNYGELYDALTVILKDNANWYDGILGEFGNAAPEEAPDVEFGDSVPSAPNDSPTGGDTPDYSDTNLQVVGVQESDILKTDGRYIYAKSYDTLRIVRVEGENVTLVSTISLSIVVGDYDESRYCGYTDDMYVAGDRLVLFKTEGKYGVDSKTGIEVYDISDRTAPKKIASYAQGGEYASSRMIGNNLYLVTSQRIGRGDEIDREDPSTFVPEYEVNGEEKLVSADSIYVNKYANKYVYSTNYAIISGIDVGGNTAFKSVEAVLGAGSCFYCSAENFYIAAGSREKIVTENSGSVQIVEESNSTVIMKFSLSDGNITYKTSGLVRGVPLNQFSMDEKDGYFRIVTTASIHRYKKHAFDDGVQGGDGVNIEETTDANGALIPVDEAVADISQSAEDQVAPLAFGYWQTNDLYILDGELNVVGSIKNLAHDETVYSVRFDGDIGYFVTFRQIDPLFSVDLSDPENPVILGELKIPGFSNYLHPFSDGLLFGLGINGNEFGGTDYLKLSMFDVSDPTNVTECAKLVLEGHYYSPASSNHKAIMVNSVKNIIAFQTDGIYFIYSYTDGQFVLRGTIDGMNPSSRGLYIGDYFYICDDNGIKVCSLEDFTVLNTLNFRQSSSAGTPNSDSSIFSVVEPGVVDCKVEQMECVITGVDLDSGMIWLQFFADIPVEVEIYVRDPAIGFYFDDYIEANFVRRAEDGNYSSVESIQASLNELEAGMKCLVSGNFTYLAYEAIGKCDAFLIEIDMAQFE